MIEIIYGDHQRFRYRHGDINILGRISPDAVPATAEFRLNGGVAVKSYVEPNVGPGKGKYAWRTNSPSVFRLQNRAGWFNVEFSIDSPDLVDGMNQVEIRVRTRKGVTETKSVEFHWDPSPLTLPLQIKDLQHADSLQDIGQAVNGVFELDREANTIRSVAPVGADVLFLLGSPHGNQEATYEVSFTTDQQSGVYIGLSDFFVGHSEQAAGLGIKPGYSTAGLATISPRGWGQLWIADGDCLKNQERAWMVRSPYPSRFVVTPNRPYRVRHQVFMTPEENAARFRIWPADKAEPEGWLCGLDTRRVDPKHTRLNTGSFGLFQFGGQVTEWSDIAVKALDPNPQLMHQVLQWQHPHLIGSIRKAQKAILDRWARAFAT